MSRVKLLFVVTRRAKRWKLSSCLWTQSERISLGIKQLDQDPFSDYTAVNDRGTIVKGKVIETDVKEVVIELAEDVTGIMKASEISLDRVEDARSVLAVDDEVEVKIINVDRKNRTMVCLSKRRMWKKSVRLCAIIRNKRATVLGLQLLVI